MDCNETRITETYSQVDIEVDRDEGVIRGAQLCASESRNNRIYEQSALDDLEKLYRQTPIRIGHDETSYLKTVGSAQEIKQNKLNGTIHGALSLNKGHPVYEQIMEDAAARPHLLKLSHEIPAGKYKARKEGGKLRIERVYAVDCLAVVTDGGVNRSLYEHDEGLDMAINSIDDLKKELPAVYEEARQEGLKSAGNDTKLAEAIAGRDSLQAQLDEQGLEMKKLSEQVARYERTAEIRVMAAELEVQCSDSLLEALVLLDTDEKVKEILEGQPKLTEEVSQEEEKPESKAKQAGGVGKPNRRFASSASAWLERYTGN